MSAITVVFALSISACSSSAPTGARCGGAQYANSRAVLPDTGINGGSEVMVVFNQRDPFGGEETDLIIEHLWPAGRGSDPEPDPRVRLVTDDGRVLLDTLARRYDQPTGKFDLPTWLILYSTRSAELRNAFFDAFNKQTLWLELWHANAPQPGTRVRLRTEAVGVSAVGWCL